MEYLSLMLKHGLGLKTQRGIKDTSGGQNSTKPKGRDEKAWSTTGEKSLHEWSKEIRPWNQTEERLMESLEWQLETFILWNEKPVKIVNW